MISILGKPIFSLDIHPDGSRFATGGQGKDSGRVTIWNLGPVIYQEYEKNENVPKLLCQLDNHLSCVNCVRWNHSGKFLGLYKNSLFLRKYNLLFYFPYSFWW